MKNIEIKLASLGIVFFSIIGGLYQLAPIHPQINISPDWLEIMRIPAVLSPLMTILFVAWLWLLDRQK